MNHNEDEEKAFHDRDEGILVVLDDFRIGEEAVWRGEMVDDEMNDEDNDDEDAADNFEEPEPSGFSGFGGRVVHFYAVNIRIAKITVARMVMKKTP